jgi:hypothetical protein
VNSSGRPWLGGGPTTLEEKGGGEGQLHFWGQELRRRSPSKEDGGGASVKFR